MFHKKRIGLHALCFFPDEVSLLIQGKNLLWRGGLFLFTINKVLKQTAEGRILNERVGE